MSQIEALSPVFSYSNDATKFCVIERGRNNLLETGRSLTTTGGLVGIYVTEDPESDYNDDPNTYGRVVALVRPLPMPPGRTVEDFPSECPSYDAEGNPAGDRWPIGWPCEVVFYSDGGPRLRDVYSTALHRWDYGTFTHQFLKGPIALTRVYLRPLRQLLMAEVNEQIKRHPETLIRPFGG